MYKYLLLVFIFGLIGCKESIEPIKEQKIEQTLNRFYSITLDVLVKKDDSFHIYYMEENDKDFVEEKSVWVEFTGSETNQKIVFNLQENVYPNQLRIDFGIDNRQTEIKLNSILIEYFGKSKIFIGIDVFNYFRPNDISTAVDLTNLTLKSKLEKAGPSFYPLDNKLNDELKKLAK